MTTWKDELVFAITAFFIVGGVLFWFAAFIVLGFPQLAGRLSNSVTSIIINNVAGYDYDSYLRNIAVAEVEGCFGNDDCQIAKLMHYVHYGLEYVPDVVVEMYRTPREILESGYADCSGYSVAFSGLARQVGMPSRIVTEMMEGRSAHAFVIVETAEGIVYKVDPTNNYYEVVE